MKKIFLKTAGVFSFIMALSFSNQLNAQTSNTIEEVKLSQNDGFTQLRQLVINNFDFTNPNLTDGISTSNVEFTVAENGKITDIHAKGDCKYVSEELENVMKNLLYKVDVKKLNNKMMASTYIMPVSVKITSR